MSYQRIRMTVRYDGTGFAGSQIQPGRRTVAGTLKTELESLTGAPVHLQFAGRTDSGVHAEGNVCAFDAVLPFPAARLARIINRRLPGDLAVRDAREAQAGFHPRFDAFRRVYVYRVYRTLDVPIDRSRYVAAVEGPWDKAALECALSLLAGERSFVAFSEGSRRPEDYVCRLAPVLEERQGLELSWTFQGNRFLRHMVCRLAGALLAIAAGKLSVERFERALNGEKEFRLKPAPAKGLTLLRVEYPDGM